MSTTLKRIFNMVAVLLIAALVAGFLMVSPTEAKSKAPQIHHCHDQRRLGI